MTPQRAAIIVALEALEVGDQAFAVELLLGTLEDGPRDRPYRCSECGLGFEWPGLLAAHEDAVHEVGQAA